MYLERNHPLFIILCTFPPLKPVSNCSIQDRYLVSCDGHNAYANGIEGLQNFNLT
jgi:hypothetical protein